MTAAQRRYVRTEMFVAAIINAVLSIVFMLLLFGGQQMVAVSDLIADSIPQTLMIALMSTLVPTMLTRRRLATGRIEPLSSASRRSGNVLILSITVATVAATVAYILHATFLPQTGRTWPFLPALLFKATYGAIIGAAISRHAVIAAMRN